MLLPFPLRRQSSQVHFPLQLAGKRPNGSAAVNSVDPKNPPQLLLADKLSGKTFLIDTGAQVSLVPASASDRSSAANHSSPQLTAANGTRIPSYGTRASRVSLGGRLFPVTLVVADVRRPILGADFLRRHNLLVDVLGQRLIDARSFNSYMQGIEVCCTPETPVAAVSDNAFANFF